IFQWGNVPKAVIQGLEGNLTVPVTESINWRNNLTWMLESKNKTTGDYLSITPEFTLNSSVDWQATEKPFLPGRCDLVWSPEAEEKYNYKVSVVTGSATNELSPYALFGLSSTYKFNKNLSVTGGVDNLFDKRLFRAGNAQDVVNNNVVTIAGAGAATYNEPGRTFLSA
ncbi:TonB-dependent receptor domain-containing protein, partial [Pectobacterium brasiliense]|uniref:TonB-dependent receptor domain-containing protein n=1 Tax=Pectobacterium brasiliense TaxID=180957 RepID=UPI0019697BAF